MTTPTTSVGVVVFTEEERNMTDVELVMGPTNGLLWPTWDGPLTTQPRNTAELYALAGDPRHKVANDRPDAVWVKNNIIECHGRTAIPGLEKFYFSCHRLVEPYVREAFRRSFIVEPTYITRAGCFVFRHMQHNSKMPLSRHAHGWAVDIESGKNGARRYKRGQAPAAWSKEWKRVWPQGLPESIVRAWQSCGWAWGADWDEDNMTVDEVYVDPMHMEWIARSGAATNV